MIRDDIVHLLYQIHTLKRDMTTTLLEKANSEESIFEYLLMWIIANEVHQSNSHIVPVVGNGFTIQQEQHALQIRNLVTPPAPVQAIAPFIVLHQIVNDNLLAKITGVIRFVVPA